MKKRKYFYLCMSIAFLWITGCTTKTNLENIAPSPTVEGKENKSTKIQEPVFQEEEKKDEAEKTTSKKTSSKKIITKTEGLCEELEEVETDVELYNSFNRMLDSDIAVRVNENSVFCLDETTGVIYFVNQGKDNFLYRIKDGEVKLAVAMPVQQIYSYEGSVYFMVDNYGTYQLEGMKTGDIYCYTPFSGEVELVYAVGTMVAETVENARDYKLLVEKSGIYFCYNVKGEDLKSHTYYYSLPFGASEPIKDKWCTAEKGWKEYYFGGSSWVEEEQRYVLALVNRITGERTRISARGLDYCVIGDILYYGDNTSVECVNLETGEKTSYDFVKAMERTENLNGGYRLLQSFTMTEDALWITTWGNVYRMDLQTKEITCGVIRGKRGTTYTSYAISELYTDGKEVYGLTDPMTTGIQKGVVRLVFTDTIDILGEPIVKIELEYLTE